MLYEALLQSTVLRRGVLPAVNPAQKEQALAAALPYYPAVRELNRRADGSEKTYLCAECGYHARTASAGDWHGTYPYRWTRMESHSDTELAALLRKAGFRWVLVGRAEARRVAAIYDWPFAESAFVQPGAPLQGVELVYADTGYLLLKLW